MPSHVPPMRISPEAWRMSGADCSLLRHWSNASTNAWASESSQLKTSRRGILTIKSARSTKPMTPNFLNLLKQSRLHPRAAKEIPLADNLERVWADSQHGVVVCLVVSAPALDLRLNGVIVLLELVGFPHQCF